MATLSTGSTLIWFLAEFEALAAHYPETTAWHFLVASFKLCDLDVEEFLRSAPEEAQKKRQEIIDGAQGLKDEVERRCAIKDNMDIRRLATITDRDAERLRRYLTAWRVVTGAE